MTIKKGIVVKKALDDGANVSPAPVHKLVDTGVFELGLNATTTDATGNIKLQGKLNIVGPNAGDDTASDVSQMITDVADAITDLEAKENGTDLTGTGGTDHSTDEENGGYDGYDIIQQDLDNKIHNAIGTAEDGSTPLTVAAQTWESQNGVANITGDTVNHIFGTQGTQITYKEADRLLAVEIDKSGSAEANKGLHVRLETRLKGNEQMEGSVKNSIAKVIWEDVAGKTLDEWTGYPDGDMDTIYEIQKAFMTGSALVGGSGEAANTTEWAALADVEQEININSLSSSIVAYINEVKLDMLNNVATAQDDLGKLKTMLDTELGDHTIDGTNDGRYHDKDLVLRNALLESMNAIEIKQKSDDAQAMPTAMNVSASVDFDARFVSTSLAERTAAAGGAIMYTANSLSDMSSAGLATFKAADERLDDAISANRVDLNSMETHLDLKGKLTVHDASLSSLSFTDNQGELSIPSMDAAAARALFGGTGATAQTANNGKMVFITSTANADAGGEFLRANKFYFCEGGFWFPSSFVKANS